MARPTHLLPPPAFGGRQAAVPLGLNGGASSRAMAGSFWGDRSDTPPAGSSPAPTADGGDSTAVAPASTGNKAQPATETIGRRAGSLSDELDFPDFVGSLVKGTWDAMINSSIRQMESYSDLVAAISKPLAQFRDENVTVDHARDWLVAQHPGDIELVHNDSGTTLVPRAGTDEFGSGPSPEWLGDYGLTGQALTPELLEDQLVPMVMLGMNRIVVKDGSITARLRFRAAASDKTSVDYAVGNDPNNSSPVGSWSTRGSTSYAAPVTKVATVGVNAQTDSELNAELFGEVKINFASETLPLDRFVDDARRTLLERAARPALINAKTAPAPAVPPPSATPAVTPPAAGPPAPATPAPAAPPPAVGAPR
jgi:hypothetical protein